MIPYEAALSGRSFLSLLMTAARKAGHFSKVKAEAAGDKTRTKKLSKLIVDNFYIKRYNLQANYLMANYALCARE